MIFELAMFFYAFSYPEGATVFTVMTILHDGTQHNETQPSIILSIVYAEGRD